VPDTAGVNHARAEEAVVEVITTNKCERATKDETNQQHKGEANTQRRYIPQNYQHMSSATGTIPPPPHDRT
jgi:hypothetical protein